MSLRAHRLDRGVPATVGNERSTDFGLREGVVTDAEARSFSVGIRHLPIV